MEDDVVVDESSRTSMPTEVRRGRFSKHCRDNDCRDGEESSFFDCWDEQSDILQQGDDLWAQNAPKSVSHAKGCLSVNFPVFSVCQKLGVYSQQLPTTALQYDISSEEESLRDEIPEEAAPNDNSNDEEWWLDEVELNTVTVSNMSIDSKPVETDGR